MKRLLSLVLVMVFVLSATISAEAKTMTKNEKMASEAVTELEDEIYETLKENEKVDRIVKSYKVNYKDIGYGVYKFTATIKMEDKGKIEIIFYKDIEDEYSDAIPVLVLNGERVEEDELNKAYPEFKSVE